MCRIKYWTEEFFVRFLSGLKLGNEFHILLIIYYLNREIQFFKLTIKYQPFTYSFFDIPELNKEKNCN